ncbi:MAG: hypothetical protein NT062_37495, partial [Proteobacteria bacterium]|nr:hypothetical protein [Pseudomonadota bacterium]
SNLFGISGLSVTAFGVDAAFSNRPSGKTAGLAVSTRFAIGRIAATARLALRMTGTRLTEISLGLRGTVPIPLPAGGGTLDITDPSIGLVLPTTEGFVAGTATWKGLSVGAVLVARQAPVGASLFLKVDNLALSKLLGTTPIVDLTFPASAVVLSSVPMSNVPFDRLPGAAADILASIGMATDGKVTVGAGVALVTKLDFTSGPLAVGKVLGLPSTLIVGGGIGAVGGKPVFSLFAEMPAAALDNINKSKPPVTVDSAKFFISLAADGQMAFGLEGQLGLKLEAKPITLTGRMYAVLGAGAGLRVAATLASDWVNPFGMAGVTIKNPTGVSFAVGIDGSARLMLNGAASFDGRTFELGGGVALLFSTGIPTVKGLAIRFAASELGPMTPVKVAQTMIRAMASALANATLPTDIKNALRTASTVDLIALGEAALPQNKLAEQAAQLVMRDVVLFLATPGMDGGAEFPQFNDVGVSAKGRLMIGNKTLGAFDGYLTANKGFKIATSAADFVIGPLGLKGALLDTGFGIPGVQANVPPHFRIKGDASLDGHPLANLDVDVSTSRIALKGGISVFSNSVALEGSLDKNSYSLGGSASINLPTIGAVNFPRTDASFSLSNTEGLKFSFSAKWEKAAFKIKGSYTSPSDFSLTATAKADEGTKKFSLGDFDIGKLEVSGGDGLSIHLSPNKAVVKFDGKAKFTAFKFPGFDGFSKTLDYNHAELDADLKIKHTFRVFDPRPEKLKMVDLDVTYRVFP